ncbi:hypothetical protein [Dyadobacter sp. CY323]|uniref:hypothetical protein n=1 Tax=Dyadobacter sp. CY323 TaxID=2907302 RepID=UPI001F3132EA|nr:hypothetical protein [Dyadobacter sp. CY323]MCE6991441.1 hypothetical protein [Dyadobacter sp. CY323]
MRRKQEYNDNVVRMKKSSHFMKTDLLGLILLMFVTTFSRGQNIKTEYNKLLIGSWEYDVAYDTVGVASNGIEETENFFFKDMIVTENKVRISDMTAKWNGRWEIKNTDELFIYLNNKKTLKYCITKLQDKNIELQSFGDAFPTLGYKRK